MASISPSSVHESGAHGAKGICQIIGWVCLAGFLIDTLVLALPPQLGNLEWRVSLMQQVADRSIILLIGAGLLTFGNFDNRRWLKRFSTICLALGMMFFLSCLLVIADGLKLQQQAVGDISNQASQLQTQIQNARSNPAADQNLTAAELQRAAQQLNNQANSLKQNAKRTVLKTGVSSVGNLTIVGFGLVSLGRYGLRARMR